MSIVVTQPAKIYAKALSELNLDSSAIISELNQIALVIESSSDLQAIIANSAIGYSKKSEILKAIFKDKISDDILKFLLVLTEKNRLSILDQITETYKDISAEKSGIRTVEIISAVDLDDKFKSAIIKNLEEKLHKQISPVWAVSPDIIGGLIFKIGDLVIDSSLKNKIDKLSKIMK